MIRGPNISDWSPDLESNTSRKNAHGFLVEVSTHLHSVSNHLKVINIFY